jgi:hypothetical protein
MLYLCYVVFLLYNTHVLNFAIFGLIEFEIKKIVFANLTKMRFFLINLEILISQHSTSVIFYLTAKKSYVDAY